MTPLVLVPGMMCDARLFLPQIAALSADRPIHVANISGADTTAGLAAQVLAEAPPRFALAGLSMGGIIVMEVLAQAPDRIDRIALLDTNPKAERPEVAQAREPDIAAVEAGELERVTREVSLPAMLDPPVGPTAEIVMAMALALGPSTFARQSRALQTRPDRQDALRGDEVPALVLCGSEDRLCPVSRHELMHDLIPGSHLVVLDGIGHLPTLEAPEATTEALRRWLAA